MERYIVVFEGHKKGKITLQVNVVQAENKEHAAFNAALDASSNLIIENASFSGVYTLEEIQSLELDIADNDSDKFVVIERNCHTMSVELLMKHGYLLDLVRWVLKYEEYVSRIILGEKLPSMTVTSEVLSLEMGKYAY